MNWIVPAAIVMALFYALAGGKHVMNAQRTASENWALWSDLWAAVVLVGWLVAEWSEQHAGSVPRISLRSSQDYAFY